MFVTSVCVVFVTRCVFMTRCVFVTRYVFVLLLQLVMALRECQDENGQLRAYLERIILRILETDPTLLEISDKGKKS